MTRGEGRREAGTGLIELLVSMVVFLLLLLLAAELFLESARLLEHSARRARDPNPAFAREILRSDLRAAAGVAGSLDLWSSGPLEMTRPGGLVVRWFLDERGRLSRSTGIGGAGRPYLGAVAGFRWRRRGPKLVEVEIRFRRAGGEAYVLHAAAPRPRRVRPTEERIRLLVGLRGAGGIGW